MKKIFLAGGCFWGVEKYLSNLYGVVYTECGYANGIIDNPSYREVCSGNTEFAEAVMVNYDETKISLSFLLSMFYKVIDPTSLNRQGNDRGTQYRTGIYFEDSNDFNIIKDSLIELQKKYEKKLFVEALPIKNYYKAEEYHQKYLDKIVDGYCHISFDKFEEAKKARDKSLL